MAESPAPTEGSTEEDSLFATNYLLVTVVEICIGVSCFLYSFVIGYSCASFARLRQYDNILSYIVFLGFSGMLQCIWGLYLVIGELYGYWAIPKVTGCYVVVLCERFVESLPFLIFTGLCFDLSGLLSSLPQAGRRARPIVLVLLLVCFICAINIPIFASTRIVKTEDNGQTFHLCVTGIPTHRLVILHRIAILVLCYIGPFCVCLFLHFYLFLCKPFFCRVGIFTAVICLVRWGSWLPAWIHITVLDVDRNAMEIETAIRLWTVAAIVSYVALVIEGVLYLVFIWQLRVLEQSLSRVQNDRTSFRVAVRDKNEVKL